jgi:hypothetical protein
MGMFVCVFVCVPYVDQFVFNLTLSIYGSHKWQLFVPYVTMHNMQNVST